MYENISSVQRILCSCTGLNNTHRLQCMLDHTSTNMNEYTKCNQAPDPHNHRLRDRIMQFVNVVSENYIFSMHCSQRVNYTVCRVTICVIKLKVMVYSSSHSNTHAQKNSCFIPHTCRVIQIHHTQDIVYSSRKYIILS